MTVYKKNKLLEALFEIIAETDYKDDGLEILSKITAKKNVSLDYDKGTIEIQDKNGVRVLYKITIT